MPYEDSFYEIKSSSTEATEETSRLSNSFAYLWLVKETETEYSSSATRTTGQTNYVIATMRIERYYTSLKEESSKFSDDAILLLRRQDYVGFFKSCGPNYVRGVRRAQEVTASIKFQSSSTETASEFSKSIKGMKYGKRSGAASTQQQKFSSINRTVEIKIVGFGLGMSEQGSETLLATSLEEFGMVMKFAFNTMTKAPNAHHIGMVYGMEVRPWTEHVLYQLETGVQDDPLELPLSRSLIPKAYRRSDPTDTNFFEAERDEFRCKDPVYEIDMYGYCCEEESLYNHEQEEYDSTSPELRVCRPVRTLDGAIVRENMSSNGEFIARLDRLLRLKQNQLSTIEKCISSVRAIPERFDAYHLKPNAGVKYDREIELLFTAFEMKMALDPFNDYSIITHISKEIEEFIEMYYQPCLASLFGANIGTSSQTDAALFGAYPWYSHDACTKLSCLASNTRWDRKNGGCVSSIIVGVDSARYEEGDNELCKTDVDVGYEDTAECKYKTSDLQAYHSRVTSCWNQTFSSTSIAYYMDHFCMPEISSGRISDAELQALKDSVQSTCV